MYFTYSLSSYKNISHLEEAHYVLNITGFPILKTVPFTEQTQEVATQQTNYWPYWLDL
jgi:hypothetical protein